MHTENTPLQSVLYKTHLPTHTTQTCSLPFHDQQAPQHTFDYNTELNTIKYFAQDNGYNPNS